MKSFRWLVFLSVFVLLACQTTPPLTTTILNNNQATTINSKETIPLLLLTQAGIVPQPYDKVLLNGQLLPLDQALPQTNFIQLQVRHAVPVTINTPQGQKVIQSAAFTVGQVLQEAGIQVYANDYVNPAIHTPITGPVTVTYTPAQAITIFIGDKTINTRSAAETVGEVLAEAGIPLTGLDTSSPREDEAPPADGQIRVVRVAESVAISLEEIPYTTQTVTSPDVQLGQSKVLQSGIKGLAMVRTRIRYEGGKEVSRIEEDKTVVREPQAEIVQSGEKIVLEQVPAGDIPYKYWTAVQMYATVYSPCNSGTGSCSYGTASGARAGKGIVAVDYSIYSYLAGMRVYIPGYGIATIGDTGGGPIIESAFGVQRTQWIDLGFNDNDITDMTGWVTVYFLEPAPAEIPYFLK